MLQELKIIKGGNNGQLCANTFGNLGEQIS